MKKAIILLILIALSVGAYSCGGGAGGLDTPGGSNPGVASVVQLTPEHWIAQTNAFITFRAKVLDGNGAPIPNTKVDFTNLSLVGTFQTASIQSTDKTASAAASAYTDGNGIASIRVYSTTSGFATVTAQVYIGSGNVRDQRTVYFTTNDVLEVTMDMDVDSVPGNGSYNQTDDITLFQTTTDDTVEILVTVRNAGGVPVAGESVTWSADHAEAVFIRSEANTNTSGQAKAVVQVTPASIRDTVTHVNIMAYAGNGAANMVSLFLRPVVIDTAASYVTASPTVVNVGGTSTITAVVKLTSGDNAPDGTAVNFTTTCGTVTPFAQTTNGQATATFTAPATVPAGGTCTVTARVGGTIVGTVVITVTTALQVQPSAITVDGVAGGTATFTIFGGVPSYTITRNNAAGWTAPVPATVTTNGGTFVVTVPANTPATTVTYTIRDSVGTTVTATLTVGAATAFTVTPSSQTLPLGVCPATGSTATYNITGGIAPFTASTSHPDVTSFTAPAAGNNITIPVGTTSFTIDHDANVAADTAVTITITDSTGVSKTVTLNLDCP